MILLTGYYHDPDPNRRAELLECLRRNTEAVRIDEIHLFLEEQRAGNQLPAEPPFNSEKVRFVSHGRRVTYRDLFNYANSKLAGSVVIIANADIFFDDTLKSLDHYDLSEKLLCLSRWDVQHDGSSRFFEHESSQDAWIFRAPMRQFPCDFHLGVLGCDNRLAWEAEQAGLKLSNPGRSVRANHLHLSQVRRYSERGRLVGPAKSLPAVYLETPPAPKDQPLPDLQFASIAFHETMGYTVARLEPGASSHNNDPRPFKAVPAPLNGQLFTQVVASSVSPIDVEFLSAGKLYVLVGNDWDGHRVATSWLSETGFREGLPLLETHRGPGFEVWSLIGETGQRFVLPTQVMLVAKQLVRKHSE